MTQPVRALQTHYRRLRHLVCWLFLPGLLCLSCRHETSKTTLRIFAASSLMEAFQDLKAAFEQKYPGHRVELVFAGSQILKLQILRGATTDVFASANQQHLQELAQQGKIIRQQPLATNELVLITPRKNPRRLRSFRDILRARQLVIGTANVPVGTYTQTLFQRAEKQWGAAFRHQLQKNIASFETNVRLIRARVELGVADAGIVYKTDALASNKVQMLSIPDFLNVQAQYHQGIAGSSPRRALALRWLQFTRSLQGQNILKKRGFKTQP